MANIGREIREVRIVPQKPAEPRRESEPSRRKDETPKRREKVPA